MSSAGPVAQAPSAAGGAAGTGESGEQRQQNPIQNLASLVLRMGVMYAFMMFMKGGKKGDEGALDKQGPRVLIRPFFQRNQPLDMQLYLSTSTVLPDKLLWSEELVPLAAKDFTALHSVTLTREDLAPALDRNESMYVITRFSLPGSPSTPIREAGVSFTTSIALTEFRPPPKEEEGHSLLTGSTGKDGAESIASSKEPMKAKKRVVEESLDGAVDSTEEAAETETLEEDDDTAADEGPWLPFMKPNMTISMVDMFETHNLKSLPPHMDQKLQVSYNTEQYYPIIHFNEFWTLKHHLIALNETTEEVTLHLELNTISNMYWTFMMAFQQSFDMQKGNGLMGEKQIDDLKTVFIEGNPYFLALTFVVSLLHSVFDMLAFKNDIGFWKSNKSMEGLSATTIIINACCQVVIFFYLLDNETSTVVLLSAGVGVLIEFWKITRVMDVTVEKTAGGFPKLKFAHRGSYVDTDTKKFDDQATRYMSYALFPCVVGYFIYSLLYEKHKSWYSFILQSLVGCVYTFGFVLMCPQLYLNYKLKSVAHLPWRQMTYKFLNTIIDDLFAFVIKMPLLHRLSVFRDDAVFLIYLYQRWAYRVDKTRVNEFGFSDQPPEEEEEKDSTKPAVKDAAGQTQMLEGKPVQTTALNHAGTTQRKSKKGTAATTAAATDTAKDK